MNGIPKYLDGFCEHCAQKLQFPEALFDTNIKCPSCGVSTRLRGVFVKRTIMQYQVISDYDDAASFCKKVNAQISAGWRPLGGIGIQSQGGTWGLYQAMVKDN